jgi:hypothetical protein
MNTGLGKKVDEPVFMGSGAAHGPSRDDDPNLEMTRFSPLLFIAKW